MSGGGIFGWAKPVPVNPRNYGNPRVDNLKVSAAGPASNIMLASVCTVICVLLILFGIRINELIFKIFLGGIQINILLAVFNMIPLAPLDGSHILEYFMPYNMLEGYHRFQRVGSVILLLLIMSGFIFGVSLIWIIISPPFNFFYNIFISIIEIFL
jgi:Zn-dependent protease